MVRRESQPNNSSYPKGGVSCSKDPDGSGWLIIRRGGFQNKFCGKNTAHRKSAKHWQ
jgi:hypothetical protein